MSQLESRFSQAVMDAMAANQLPLPSVPDAALRIGQICKNRDATAAAVADEINKDPSIAVRIVRVANSAAQRGGQRVTSTQQAVTRLGLETVRQLAYALSMQQLFLTESPMLGARLREAWTQSVAVAALAHALAGRCTSLAPENALLAGLLHQIGVMPIIQLAEKFHREIDSRETLENVIDHLQADVGRVVLYAWGFPHALVGVPDGCRNFARKHGGAADYVDLVIVALLLADEHQQWNRYAGIGRDSVPAFAALGLDAESDLLRDPEFVKAIDERLAWLTA